MCRNDIPSGGQMVWNLKEFYIVQICELIENLLARFWDVKDGSISMKVITIYNHILNGKIRRY